MDLGFIPSAARMIRPMPGWSGPRQVRLCPGMNYFFFESFNSYPSYPKSWLLILCSRWWKPKWAGKKGPPTDSDSDESYRGSFEEETYARPKQSTKKSAVKRNVRGRGAAYSPGQGRGTRRQSSSTVADPSNPRVDPNDDIDISHLENVMATV